MGLLTNLLRGLRGNTDQRDWTAAQLRERMRRGDVDGAAAALERLAADKPQRDVVVLCLRGEIAYKRQQDAEAERCFREALALAPGSPDAHHGLSLVLQARGETLDALRHAQFAANNSDQEARFWAQLGLCQVVLQNYVQADEALELATRLDPQDKYAWNNFGIATRANGELDRARAAFQRALALDPGFALAAENLTLLNTDLETATPPEDRRTAPASEALRRVRDIADAGDMAAAIDACETLADERPDDGAVIVELYRLYFAAGDTQSGIDALQAFHVRHPEDVDVVAALGSALVWAREFKRAKPLVTAALERRPDDPRLLVAMSEIRAEQGRYAETARLLRRSFELEPTLEHKGMLANALVKVFEYEEAVRLFDEIVAEAPVLAGRLEGIRIYSLMYLGRQDEALPLVDEAIRQNPNEPVRRFPRATIHLHNERYAEGWEDYAFRQLASATHLRTLPFPEWHGETLEGRSILVLAEQGLGDQVMFASCLPDLLKQRPSRIVVEAIDRVAPTLQRSFPTCEVVATQQDSAFDWVLGLGAIDYHVHMGDLPRHFRRWRADFPDHSGYLKADPARVEHWRDALSTAGRPNRPHIGVTWRGGTEMSRQGVRTMGVTMLAPLMAGTDADWVCLQYGDVTSDLDRSAGAGAPMLHWPQAIRDLDEFAALVSALDLVITVCNTTVHYAGALAKPVWVMAPKVPEWRYGLHFESMPWYPSTRMFRQPQHGDWPGLLNNVHDALGLWLAQFDLRKGGQS
ncbi:MAG TPA: tetratricopeptide repeat protein [Methylibium sp.]|nr:tetratricopeptide repeat protein [Methylibium sp.]